MSAKRASTSQLSKLLQGAACPICLFDESRRIVFANAALQNLLGCSEDDLLLRETKYTSEPSGDGQTDVANALCPPPQVFAGNAYSLVVALPIADDSGEMLSVRASHWPLASPKQADLSCGVISFFHELDPAADLDVVVRPHPAFPEFDPDWSPLHAALQKSRHVRDAAAKAFPIYGASPAVIRLERQVTMLAATGTSACVIGPRGAPCGQLAEFLHQRTTEPRRGRFLTVDCGLLTWDLLQESVFSFLAAIEQTDETQIDTVLIEAIDQLSAADQQTAREFVRRLADEVRVLATAQDSLSQLAEHGRFDPQLAAFLCPVELDVPALTQRREDIPLTAQACLEALNVHSATQFSGFGSSAMDELCLAPWPGDVAQLQEVIEAATARASQPIIKREDLPESFLRSLQATQGSAQPKSIDLEAYLAEIEATLIRRALDHAKGNKTKAAELLGMTRPRLYRRLEQLGWSDDS